MPQQPITREVQPSGSICITDGSCSFLYERLQPGVLLLTITGNDYGQFGPATVDEVAAEFARTKEPLKLFVDTRGAIGPVREVMETWTEWFATNAPRLQSVAVLIPPESKLLHLTVSIAQHLSRTGNLIRIFGAVEDFRAALARAAPDYQSRLSRQL
jgi:hypothetical protein